MDPVHMVNTLDLVCRRRIGKTLPHNALRCIYINLKHNERRSLPYLRDPMFVVIGSRIYRKITTGWKIKCRLRRAFRYGR